MGAKDTSRFSTGYSCSLRRLARLAHTPHDMAGAPGRPRRSVQRAFSNIGMLSVPVRDTPDAWVRLSRQKATVSALASSAFCRHSKVDSTIRGLGGFMLPPQPAKLACLHKLFDDAGALRVIHENLSETGRQVHLRCATAVTTMPWGMHVPRKPGAADARNCADPANIESANFSVIVLSTACQRD